MGAAQPRTHQNGHRSGRKCSRGPRHQCPGPGNRAGTLRERTKRGREKRIKKEEGKMKGNKQEKKRRVGKTEEERK